MEKDRIKLTRKIQLQVDAPTHEEKREALETLYRWQNRCYRAANLIVTHLYIQEMIKEFFYLSEGIKYRLADEKKDIDGILNRSKTNCTYRVVSDRFKGEIPTNILANLNNGIMNSFHTDLPAYRSGERALSNFRRDIAFPFGSRGIQRLTYSEEKKTFCFRLFSIPLKAYLGRDYTDKRRLLEQVIAGEIKLCASKIQLKNQKIYWLAVFEMDKEKHSLKPQVIAEASLSLEYPIIVKSGKATLSIGSREEFLYRRLAIQAALKRAQNGVAYCRPGKGRKRKTKAIDRFHEREKKYVGNRLHLYSRKLIDFCIEQKAGTLILLNQEDKMEIAKKEDGFVLRNWNYHELMNKIKYKADKAGIELIVD
tara:strand:- start:7410 stop:8510 length:1101 start_codon:yes stop_codon:yes gene_type:complete